MQVTGCVAFGSARRRIPDPKASSVRLANCSCGGTRLVAVTCAASAVARPLQAATFSDVRLVRDASARTARTAWRRLRQRRFWCLRPLCRLESLPMFLEQTRMNQRKLGLNHRLQSATGLSVQPAEATPLPPLPLLTAVAVPRPCTAHGAASHRTLSLD